MNAKELGLIMSLSRCIEMAEGTAEMQQDAAKRARSPRGKKLAKNSFEFFEAVTYHLKRLREIEKRNETSGNKND
jgi:hypothetical protein